MKLFISANFQSRASSLECYLSRSEKSFTKVRYEHMSLMASLLFRVDHNQIHIQKFSKEEEEKLSSSRREDPDIRFQDMKLSVLYESLEGSYQTLLRLSEFGRHVVEGGHPNFANMTLPNRLLGLSRIGKSAHDFRQLAKLLLWRIASTDQSPLNSHQFEHSCFDIWQDFYGLSSIFICSARYFRQFWWTSTGVSPT